MAPVVELGAIKFYLKFRLFVLGSILALNISRRTYSAASKLFVVALGLVNPLELRQSGEVLYLKVLLDRTDN